MIGNTTSLKPAPVNVSTKRDSIRRRRAVSPASRGRTPVGYLDLVAIKSKTSSRIREEVQVSWLRPSLSAPRPIGARAAPLDVMMMVLLGEVGTHRVGECRDGIGDCQIPRPYNRRTMMQDRDEGDLYL